MQLENYFEFLAEDDIRLKGHRIGIEDILKYYLNGYSPEEILSELPSLNLEKIYATLTYYHQNQTAINAYLFNVNQRREQNYQNWQKESSPLIQRLKQAKSQKLEKNLTLLNQDRQKQQAQEKLTALLQEGLDSPSEAVTADYWHTLYLLSIPGMRQSIQEGLNTPIENCDEEIEW